MSFADKGLPGLIPNFLCPPWGPNSPRVPEWEQPRGGRWGVPGMPGSAFPSQGSSSKRNRARARGVLPSPFSSFISPSRDKAEGLGPPLRMPPGEK